MGIGELVGLIVLVADIWAIVNVMQSRSSTGGKVVWVVGILVFPLLGFLVWLFAGPRSAVR